VLGILAVLMAGQLLAVAVVVFVVGNVPIREHDSYLTAARLLRTAMNTAEARSMASAKELAESVKEKLTTEGIRYGTRVIDEKRRCMDVWEDVERKFPKDVKYD